MVRKSLEGWHQARRASRIIRRQDASQAVAADLTDSIVREFEAKGNADAVRLLKKAAAGTVTLVELPGDEYDVYVAVASLLLEHRGTGDLAGALRAEFGSVEAVEDALAIYRRWQRALDKAKATGKTAELVPLTGEAERDEEIMAAVVASRRPKPPMPPAQIFRYSAQRAVDLGFDPGVIWSKEQGRRSPDAKAAQQARAQIVAELRDRGATLPDIGALFGGRKKQSVAALERAGRKQQEANNG